MEADQEAFSERSEKVRWYFMFGTRLALLFNIVCVVLSHPKIYPKIKHICILRIMGRIGGADYNDKW